MCSNLSFGRVVAVGQTFDVLKLELNENVLELDNCTSYSNLKDAEFQHSSVITDHRDLYNLLVIKPANLMSLMLGDSKELDLIKSFLMPPVDQYLLANFEFPKKSKIVIRPEVCDQQVYFVNRVFKGVIVMLRVIAKKNDYDLYQINKQLLDHVTPRVPDEGDFIIETLVNWSDQKQHETFGEAMNYIKEMSKAEKQCFYRYTLNQVSGQKPWQADDFREQSILEHLYWSNRSFGQLNNFLKRFGQPEVRTDKLEEFRSLYAYECIIPSQFASLKAHDVFRLQTISKFFKDLIKFLESFAMLRNTIVKYLKCRLTWVTRNEAIELVKNGKAFKEFVEKIEKLCSYPIQSVNEKNFFVVDKSSDLKIFDRCEIVLRLRDESCVPLILDKYDKFEENECMLAICDSALNQKDAITVCVPLDSTDYEECGFVSCKTMDTSKKHGRPYAFLACACGCRVSRYWMCRNCTEFVFERDGYLFCSCGKMKKEDCEFECFSPQHGKRSYFEIAESTIGVYIRSCESTSSKAFVDKPNLDVSASYTSAEYKKPSCSHLPLNEELFGRSKPTDVQVPPMISQPTGQLEAPLSREDPPKKNGRQCMEKKESMESKENIAPPQKGVVDAKNVKKTAEVANKTVTKTDIDWNSTGGKRNESTPEKNLNILLVGKMGVGKSTLLNAFNNYSVYTTPEAAQKQELHCIIPVRFNVFNEDFSETAVEVGRLDENEVFQDVFDPNKPTTQKCKVHPLHDNERTVNFIDTPGITSANKNQVVQEIKEAILASDKIHGICFVLKRNESILNQQMENVMKELILFCPKTMLDKVYFFMTHSMGTFYGPGDSMQPLKVMVKNLKESNKIDVPLTKENIFCFDNESFRFLCARSRNVDYKLLTEHSYHDYWNKSRTAMYRFFDEVCAKGAVVTKDVDHRKLLQPVVSQLKDYASGASFKQLKSDFKWDLYRGYYFCLKKLIELETDDCASELFEKMDPTRLHHALFTADISDDFVISDLTLWMAVKLFKQYCKSTPELGKYLNWLGAGFY